MITLDQILAKQLNQQVTDNNFIDKDLNDYLYASLSQPPIKIIDKCGSDDELDYIVECPNCKKHVNYGTSIFMISGHLYCENDGCRESLIDKHECLTRYK